MFDSRERLFNINFNIVAKIGSDGKPHGRTVENICSFDIECANGFRNELGQVVKFDHEDPDKFENMEAQSLLYHWQIAIEDYGKIRIPEVNKIYKFHGRTYEDLDRFFNELNIAIQSYSRQGCPAGNKENAVDIINTPAATKKGKASKFKIRRIDVPLYIHNLGYEFQHLRNLYGDQLASKPLDFSDEKTHYQKVFARNLRRPMKGSFQPCLGLVICLRDTLVLTQKSLEAWGEDENLPIQKRQEPDGFHEPIRTPETELTQEELDYCEQDVVTMVYGLQKYRDKYGTLSNIPMTQTGQVRRKCVEAMERDSEWCNNCIEITKSTTFSQMVDFCNLFSGGYTHANASFADLLVKQGEHDRLEGNTLYTTTPVVCFDFASKYPSVMASCKFPVSKFEPVDRSHYEQFINSDPETSAFRWYMKVKLKGVECITENTFWSASKCLFNNGNYTLKDSVEDNGRIKSADEMEIIITDLDWDIFKQTYVWESLEVVELQKSTAGYLSRELILVILDYFRYKTTLKGLDNELSKYMESKQFINSIYGVAVTKVISDIVEYCETEDGGQWKKHKLTKEIYDSQVANTSDKTFLAFQHGIWVTAWARYDLWKAILHLDCKVIYCDTDSIKGIFRNSDIEWIQQYNSKIRERARIAAKETNIPIDKFTARTEEKKIKELGIFEREEDCVEFKTLGAKRYCDRFWNAKKNRFEVATTVAGLPKRAGAEKFKRVDDFKDGTVFSTKESHKLCSIYTGDDNPQTPGVWIDRDGKKYTPPVYPRYGLCLKPVGFNLEINRKKGGYYGFISSLDREAIGYLNETPACLLIDNTYEL